MIITLLINLILSNAVTLSRSKSIIYSRFVIISLISTALMAYSTLYVNPLSEGIGLYGGLFTITTFTLFFNIFIYIISGIILGLSSFFPRKLIIDKYSSIYYLFSHKLLYNKYSIANKAGEQFRIIEYALIIVFIICGGVFLISTADLISIFLSIELQSYGLYIISTIYRDSESSTTSGLTYFLLGGMSSCFILLGSALLYANSGTTSLDNIYIITSISEVFTNYKEVSLYGGVYFHLAIIILCVGLLFKVSAAPFHFWSPDVYDGIPTIVTTYVAIVAKISIFAFLMELVYYTEYIYFNFSWKVIFILSSILSLIIGSVLGLTQFRIKRLFAYSTISHVGFILLALSINTIESIQSYIFYIVQYTISNLNAFIILVTIGFSLYFNHLFKEDINISLPHLSEKDKSIELIKEKSINSTNKDINVNLNKVYENKLEKSDKLIDENNSPIQLISQIKGYFYVNPFIAISLGITLFSFVGIPPLVGFFAKQMILSAALDSGYYFVTFIAILTSVIGAAYYLNLIKEIFFYKPLNTISSLKTTFISTPLKAYLVKNTLLNGNDNEETVNNKVKVISFNINDIKINGFYSTIISILTLLLLLFIYMPDEWFNIANILSLILFKS